MSSYNKTCLISGTQIKTNEKVNIFFLASTGNYKNNKTVMVGDLVYPWSAFKVIAGVSVNANYNGYGKFEIIENRRSEIVLSYIKELSGEYSLSYDNLFKLISEGKVKLKGSTENVYLSVCFIASDIYKKLIDIAKEDFEKYIDKDFKTYHQLLENESVNPNINDLLKDEIIIPEVGYLQQYMYGRKNPFSYIKTQIDINYNEFKFLEDFKNDILIVEAMKSAGILFSTTMNLNEDVNSDIKSKILKLSLIKSLTHSENEEYLNVNYDINVIQKLKLTDMENYFNCFKEDIPEYYISFLKFKEDHKNINEKLIKKEDIFKYEFLSNSLIKKEEDLLIIFEK